MIAIELPPLGTRVHVVWSSTSGGGYADGYVASRWACPDCFTIPPAGPDGDETANVAAIEAAGLTCAHVAIIRIRTDDGRDVMVHRADDRVLVVPIADHPPQRREGTA